ncbi:alpha/beta hydrolase [Bacillus atrophaeus]|uniref:alpha/beta hydrolase n=1 Tax=Bacillus atrophaeus TaxID=1452 RepID=UPI002281A260|nr:alpha/beta hydrolase [Bacillus atrophaeus]MCY8960525.1 alpha/beta hydrolase [Bacillus atrophaeus]MCY8962216.1 alpha/beta hydrolase [Bacillus atrophaeus]MCY9160861.1 alpha/beta hydrolase [Bacillus atrophaeus]MCY9438979.1 alpha/beta hydrolase [Bacillus atrophaeus]MEC0649850.1 alpha/beta hydrolase [Bacillus atrophaeus]
MDGKKTEQAAALAARAFTIPGTESRLMYSRTGKREYQIFVSKPSEDPPPAGYPVIYLLDANSVFGTMAEAIRVQSRRPEKTGVIPAVIVGIGYQTEAPFSPARHCDFTLPLPDSELPSRPGGTPWPEQGGAEDFLTFIEEEVKPEIERDYQIDTSRQTIFGHSLGGLFVLQVLFTKPDAFQTYIAGSPSIHWNKRFIHKESRQFGDRVSREKLNVNVMLAAGELEKSHKSRINDHAKELSEQLSSLAGHGVRTQFHEFEGEGHISVLPVLISRALRFALHPDGPNL